MKEERPLESPSQTRATLAECGVIDLAPDGTIDTVNTVILRWTDHTADDLIGASVDSILALRLTDSDAGDAPADASLRGRSGSLRDVVVASIDDGRRLVLFDLSANSSFARSFAVGDTRSSRGQRRLEVLLNSSRGFADARTEDEVAELLADVARRSFDTMLAGVHLGRGEAIELVAGASPLLSQWPADHDPVGMRTLMSRQVFVVRTPEDAAALAPGTPMDEVFRAAGIHAAIASPITVKGVPLGAVICYFGHPRDFDDEAVPLIEALASQAAQAIARIRLEDESRRRAGLDAITGLPGRRSFEVEVETQLERAQTDLCLMFIDLDRFKAINDVLGHAEGDRVLHHLGERLESIVRAPDIVGRFGGDEFVVLAHVDGDDGCRAMSERIRAATAQPYPDLPENLTISASIGVVLVKQSATRGAVADQLIRIADHNMYAAKRAGGDRVEATTYGS